MTEPVNTRKHPPTRAARRPRPRLRRTLHGFARSLTLSVISAGTLLALLCALIVLQGQRDEAQPAGAAVVFGASEETGDLSSDTAHTA